jgi:acid phosphatase (class A)
MNAAGPIRRLVLAVLAGGLLLFGPVAAQQREATPPPAGEAKPVGYLPADAVDYHSVLTGPPAEGSYADRRDVATITSLQTRAGPQRWQTAVDDDAFLFPRFDEAFGAPIDREHAPLLVALLNRVIRDVAAPTFAAKAEYLRARPYQRFQLSRVCGEASPPSPDPNPMERSSYPSGHAAYGWAVARVLALAAPDRADALLALGRDYGLSREICGMHFPSDVAAGKAVSEAVVRRLMADPAFRADLAAVRAEHRAGG